MEYEIWKPVVGYEGWYSISNYGRVRRDKAEHGSVVGRILKINISKLRKYPAIALWKLNIGKTKEIHIHVAHAFLGPCPDGKEINHKDRNTHNFKSDNLEYITHQENVLRGSNHIKSKFTEAQIIKIRADFIPRQNGYEKIAKQYSVTRQTIFAIIKRKTWKHI